MINDPKASASSNGPSKMPSTFIFVHDGFGSPAELAPTIPHLEGMGHEVLNIDLPSEQANATLDDYAATVVKAMADTSGPRILVAHSAGGATIPLAAAHTPVDRLVYVAAIVPQRGQSIYEALGPQAQQAIMSVSVDNGDGTRSFDLDLLASLVPEDRRQDYLEFLQATQRKQGMKAMYQPWPGRGTPDIPRTYILCTEDQIIHPERQHAFAALLGVVPIKFSSEHSAFAARPKELAGILDSLA